VPFKQDDGSIIWIEKSACGAQAQVGNQAVQSTNAYKGSMSDCLKKCASLFGIALQLYRDDTEEAYFQSMREDLIPDTWTSEAIKQYEKQYNKLMKLLEEYQWSIDDLSYYVSLVSDGQYTNFRKMPPEFIDNILTAIEEE
jgi:hypothetical protein